MPHHHSAREIIQVIDIMYLKAQNLARELHNKELTQQDIERMLDDIKEHAKQVANG